MASRTTARHTDPFWPVGATGTAPGERPKTAAALDAAARTALRASCEVVPAPAPRGRHTPGGVRHPMGHRTDLGVMWLDHQYRLCGGATRWLKRSFGFWEDRELKMNPLTS